MSGVDEVDALEQARARTQARALRGRQVSTVALLFAGYAAYYFCRANFSAAMPLLVADLGSHGVPAAQAIVRLGTVYSAGVLAYALGKLLLGGLGDLWGGRRSFLLGLGGATAFTLLFAGSASLPVFTIAWIGNRLTQSAGWAGLLKVCSKWFDFSAHGTVVGILSLSYLVGDAAARQSIGVLIDHGIGWRGVFVFAAAVAGSLLLANALFLRESREDLGHRGALPNPRNLYARERARRAGLAGIFRPLLTSPAFGLVCLLSFGCTIVREAFSVWTPVYLQASAGYSTAQAASLSAVFPGVGALSVLVTGWLGDRLGGHGRPLLLLAGLAATALALVVLTLLPVIGATPVTAVVMIGVVAFCLLGPYSYLGGAMALDFGGQRGGATSSGIIDGIGYLGGVLAGAGVARAAVAVGWQGVFAALAAVSAASAVAALLLYRYQRRA
ncbi:MAG: MFS transporter [Proteobacteria bacterium]|nr:MFS transporter [Pseudomonadota bacterium]